MNRNAAAEVTRPELRACASCRCQFKAHRVDAKFCSTRCRMVEYRKRQWAAAANAPRKSCCWMGPCCCVARPAPMMCPPIGAVQR